MRARQRLEVAAAVRLVIDDTEAEPSDGLPDAAEEGEEDEDGEGADERGDQPVALLEAVVLGRESGPNGFYTNKRATALQISGAKGIDR